MAPEMGKPRAVLVDPGDNGLPLGRRLHERHVPVTALCADDQSWAGRVRGVERVLLPPLPAGAPDWRQALEALANGEPLALISCSDVAVEFLAEADLPAGISIVGAASEAHLRLADKRSLYELASAAGVRTPWWRSVDTREELDEICDGVDYPCLVKPALSHVWRALFGDRRTCVADCPDSIREFAGPGIDAGIPMVISEYVPGPDSALEGALMMRAPGGEITLCYGRRKLRQYPLGFGVGTLFESANLPDSERMLARLLEVTDYVGVAALEAKRHSETGELVLLEVNTRLPQSFALGDACGADASWRVYASVAGLALPPQPEPREGVRIVLPLPEWRALRSLRERGDLHLRRLLRDYRGVRDAGVLDPRYPLAFVSFLRQSLRTRASRTRRK